MKKIVYVLSVFTLLLSCNNSKNNAEQTTTIPDTHNSKNSLDWKGVYSGVLPCADCAGIRTKIVLRDSTYSISSLYLGKEQEVESENYGVFYWSEDGSTIILNNELEPNAYQVEENRIVKLDTEGNKITGSLSENYTLKKLDHPILNQKWVLIELNGSVPKYNNNKPISLKLNGEDGRAIGFSGCNNYNGEFDMDNHELRFSKMAVTMMPCDNMELENEYARMLSSVSGFALDGETLVLNTQEQQGVAKFKKSED